MAESEGRFNKRSNENLLQLWRARDLLKDEDIDPLRDELDRRGLSKQVAEIAGQASVRDMYGELRPAPHTYINLTVPALWMRELWLRHKTRGGFPADAKIEMVQRTRFGFWGGAARAELCYSYEIQGRQYSGQVVRDFKFDSASADSLVYDHQIGEKLPILVNPDAPAISYYPSDLGMWDPIFLGFQAIFAWAVVIGLARLIFLSVTHSM